MHSGSIQSEGPSFPGCHNSWYFGRVSASLVHKEPAKGRASQAVGDSQREGNASAIGGGTYPRASGVWRCAGEPDKQNIGSITFHTQYSKWHSACQGILLSFCRKYRSYRKLSSPDAHSGNRSRIASKKYSMRLQQNRLSGRHASDTGPPSGLSDPKPFQRLKAKRVIRRVPPVCQPAERASGQMPQSCQ